MEFARPARKICSEIARWDLRAYADRPPHPETSGLCRSGHTGSGALQEVAAMTRHRLDQDDPSPDHRDRRSGETARTL